MLSSGTVIRTIGLREVQAKLVAAAPRILAENRAMVTQMLETVKTEIQPSTPLGPGHFGYHLRDTYRVTVQSSYGGINYKTVGKLYSAVEGYWREFGTRGRYQGRRASGKLRAATALMTGATSAGGGEKAGLFATRALSGVRRFIRAYYGNAQWWRL